MTKIKVLWLSNVKISTDKTTSSGGWVTEMFKALSNASDFEFSNIFLTRDKKIRPSHIGNLKQWGVPSKKVKSCSGNGNEIVSLIDDYGPDIIHIWGIETEWVYLYNRVLHERYGKKILLEIQGLKFASQQYFYNNLGACSFSHTIGVLDILLPRFLTTRIHKDFVKTGKEEVEAISKAYNISVQSRYVNELIEIYKTDAKIFKTGIILRNEFVSVKKPISSELIRNVCTVTSRATYKGLHVVLRAFAILHETHPKIRLKIFGVNVYKYVNFGYVSYLKRLARTLGITECIDWMGYADADTIISAYGDSSIYINASFIETYCLSLAEALTVGVPCVVSYSGALPELAINEKTALVFPQGDYNLAARMMMRLIDDADLRNQLSNSSFEAMRLRNDAVRIAKNQLSIYQSILENI